MEIIEMICNVIICIFILIVLVFVAWIVKQVRTGFGISDTTEDDDEFPDYYP